MWPPVLFWPGLGSWCTCPRLPLPHKPVPVPLTLQKARGLGNSELGTNLNVVGSDAYILYIDSSAWLLHPRLLCRTTLQLQSADLDLELRVPCPAPFRAEGEARTLPWARSCYGTWGRCSGGHFQILTYREVFLGEMGTLWFQKTHRQSLMRKAKAESGLCCPLVVMRGITVDSQSYYKITY